MKDADTPSASFFVFETSRRAPPPRPLTQEGWARSRWATLT